MVLVACGWRHTISVSSSGGLYTYGWSKYGQLGHGDFEDHLIPHRLEAMHGNFISQVNLLGFHGKYDDFKFCQFLYFLLFGLEKQVKE